MHFFNYGPYYAITSDANSHRPEIYGDQAGDLHDGRGRTRCIGQSPGAWRCPLASRVSGDIWYATRDNVFGKERAWLHLLLRHCGVSCDILHENELAASLAPYRVLFANDAHLKRAALAPLTAWVRDGGVLVLGAERALTE